jgi:hypothetical protein
LTKRLIGKACLHASLFDPRSSGFAQYHPVLQ